MNTDFILSGGAWLGGSKGSKRGTAGSIASRIARSCALLAVLLLALSLSAQQAPEAEQFVGPPKGTPLVSPELDQKTQELAGELRCPVCQGLAIADSPSEMAINMRRQVRELLARGFTEEQILKYFEQSYGQFVLLKPKFAGVNSLVWLLPIAVLAFGALLVVTKMKKLEVAVVPADGPRTTDHGQRTTDDPYIQRVRELVEKQ
jgi:cytochrome c-type biogenesis protein CcmH